MFPAEVPSGQTSLIPVPKRPGTGTLNAIVRLVASHKGVSLETILEAIL